MPTLDEVYAKFGQVSEAAQLLETEIGTLLLASRVNNFVSLADNPTDNALDSPFVVDSVAARKNLDELDASTLGRLIIAFGKSHARPNQLDELGLSDALKERNRLAHRFYRQHNFRRNSDSGRGIMMQDLESMHDTILKAYKAVILISGIDLDALVAAQSEAPTTEDLPFDNRPAFHLPI